MRLGIKRLLEELGLLRHRMVRGHYLIPKDELYKVWEEVHLKSLFSILNVDCVFDVGANQGQYVKMLREQVGYEGLIISFEPNPEILGSLRSSIQSASNWVVETTAIAGNDGYSSFNVMADSQFSSLSAPNHEQSQRFVDPNRIVRRYQVRTESLRTALRRLKTAHHFTRPFLKLDTQGFDTEIVRTNQDALHEFVGLQSELSVKRLYADSIDFREALSVYQDAGFELSALVPNNEGHFPELIEMDCLMFRRKFLV